MTVAVLLFALQIYWLSSSYQNQKDLFQWEAGLLLEEAQKEAFFKDLDTELLLIQNDTVAEEELSYLTGDSLKSDTMILLQQFKKSDSAQLEIKIGYSSIDHDSLQIDAKKFAVFESRVKRELNFAALKKAPNQIVESILEYVSDEEELFANMGAAYKKLLNERGMPDAFTLAVDGLNGADVIYTEGTADPTEVTWTKSFPYLLETNKSLKAGFADSGSYVLRQMSLNIAVSLGLMVLILTFFSWLIRTIYREKELTQLKDDFIGNITHEIKTPIATVSAAVEAMQKYGVLDNREKTMDYLDTASQQLSRLDLLVGQILDVSSLENNQKMIRPEAIQPGMLLQNVADGLEVLQSGNIFVENHLKEDRLFTDPKHFSTMVSYLLDNALKYGGDGVQVKLLLEDDANSVTLRVKDNGPGIERKKQEQIFDKFYRGESGNVHQTKGYGLGLYYVRKLMRLLGGRVDLQSKEGQGSEFILTFPRN